MVSPHHWLFLLLLLISTPMAIQVVRGGTLSRQLQVATGEGADRRVVRITIGSSPPKCHGRCMSCGHCEAVQVPIVPQPRYGAAKSFSSEIMVYIGNEGSNYKPMSWKCKCGNSIYDP